MHAFNLTIFACKTAMACKAITALQGFTGVSKCMHFACKAVMACKPLRALQGPPLEDFCTGTYLTRSSTLNAKWRKRPYLLFNYCCI